MPKSKIILTLIIKSIAKAVETCGLVGRKAHRKRLHETCLCLRHNFIVTNNVVSCNGCNQRPIIAGKEAGWGWDALGPKSFLESIFHTYLSLLVHISPPDLKMWMHFSHVKREVLNIHKAWTIEPSKSAFDLWDKWLTSCCSKIDRQHLHITGK